MQTTGAGRSGLLPPTRRAAWAWASLGAVLLGLACAAWARRPSAPLDERVMIQGFTWESHRMGREPGAGGGPSWYRVLRGKVEAIADAGFDLIWLPPPSFAGEGSAGYNPRQFFSLSNSYGTAAEQRALLVALLRAGVEPVADIVINHRDGMAGWADFRNPSWGAWAVCASDEAFTRPEAGLAGVPPDQRGACEETVPYRDGTTLNYHAFRDLAHTDPRVRTDILRYLLLLRSFGYRGWRYDMVHGYSGRWIACYNAVSQPTFSVGEYDWGAQGEQRGWIWATATRPAQSGGAHLASASSVMDFGTFFGLQAAIRSAQPARLNGYGRGVGLVGDSTDGLPWRSRAVTFVENHDTGGVPRDALAQAYAQILTHPGLPTVYWPHYFASGPDLAATIRTLIQARRLAGVHAASALYPQRNAAGRGVYAARIDGRRGRLYVRLGGDDTSWRPADSGYTGARPFARGAGWAVWLALPASAHPGAMGSTAGPQAARRQSLPVPQPISVASIQPTLPALCR